MKQLLKAVLAFVCTAAIVFTSCGPTAEEQSNTSKSDRNPTQTAKPSASPRASATDDSGKATASAKPQSTALPTPYVNAEETAEETALLNRQATLSADSLAAIDAVIDSLPREYPYAEISNVASAYARYRALPVFQNQTNHGLATNLPLDPNVLFDIVKANNAAYIAEKGGSLQKEFDDDYVLNVCGIICDTINRELPELAHPGKIDDLDAILADLKILQILSTTAGAAVTSDNCISINPTLAQIQGDISGHPQAFEILIAHETEHVLQRLSSDAVAAYGAERAYGFSISWADQPVNSMLFYWMIEGAAERLASHLYGSSPLTYFMRIRYLNPLTLCNILRGASYKDTARLTQTDSIDHVFTTFGCDMAAEQMELLHMLYGIEVILEEPEDFMTAFASSLGHTPTSEEIDTLMTDLQNAVFTTITKLFYRNLAQLLAGKPVALREAFYLITTFEADINYHLAYMREESAVAARSFMESYYLIQQAFMDGLAAQFSIPADALFDLLAASTARAYVPYDSIMKGKEAYFGPIINALADDSNIFLDAYYFEAIQKKGLTIRQVVNQFFTE